MMCWLREGCRTSRSEARRSPSCKLVNGSPMFHEASGRSLSLSSTAQVKNPTMEKKWRGNFERISVSIAIATFFAAAKRPSQLIDHDMSRHRTDDDALPY